MQLYASIKNQYEVYKECLGAVIAMAIVGVEVMPVTNLDSHILNCLP